MAPPRPRSVSTAMSNSRLRSATESEKNSPCLPATNTPSILQRLRPMQQIRPEPRLIQRQIGPERRQRRGPDAPQLFAGIGLGIFREYSMAPAPPPVGILIPFFFFFFF